jgi:hypothetical protein
MPPNQEIPKGKQKSKLKCSLFSSKPDPINYFKENKLRVVKVASGK